MAVYRPGRLTVDHYRGGEGADRRWRQEEGRLAVAEAAQVLPRPGQLRRHLDGRRRVRVHLRVPGTLFSSVVSFEASNRSVL